jgi:hypothetical protein
MLRKHYPERFTEAVDAQLRDEFNILLPGKLMRPPGQRDGA